MAGQMAAVMDHSLAAELVDKMVVRMAFQTAALKVAWMAAETEHCSAEMKAAEKAAWMVE
jgi:hypothetical protein